MSKTLNVNKLFEGVKKTRTNVNGNKIKEMFLPATERYIFDRTLSGIYNNGQWQQYDTPEDASYYGVWVSRSTPSAYLCRRRSDSC